MQIEKWFQLSAASQQLLKELVEEDAACLPSVDYFRPVNQLFNMGYLNRQVSGSFLIVRITEEGLELWEALQDFADFAENPAVLTDYNEFLNAYKEYLQPYTTKEME